MLEIFLYIFSSFFVGFFYVLPDGFEFRDSEVGKQSIDSTIKPVEILGKSLHNSIDDISFDVIVVLGSWPYPKDKSFCLFGWKIGHLNDEFFHLDKFLSLHTIDHGFEFVVGEGCILGLNMGRGYILYFILLGIFLGWELFLWLLGRMLGFIVDD